MQISVVVRHNGFSPELYPEKCTVKDKQGNVREIGFEDLLDSEDYDLVSHSESYLSLSSYYVTPLESYPDLPESDGFMLKTKEGDLRIGQVVSCRVKLDSSSSSSEEECDGIEEDFFSKLPVLRCVEILSIDKFPSTCLSSKECEDVRDEIIGFIRSKVNDSLVAEYLLYSLLARTIVSDEGVISMNYNITNLSADQAKQISDVLSSLSPLVCKLGLTLESFNKASFTPVLGDSYVHGELCLPRNSLLVVDETKLDEGKLTEKGTLNALAMQRFLNMGKVTFDCHSTPVDVSVYANCLILGVSKSMFSAKNSVIPLVLEPENPPVPLSSSVSVLKNYLAHVRSLEYSMSEPMANRIQEDYIKARSSKSKTLVNEDDLKRALELTRAVCISYGRSEMKYEDWARAIHLESTRLGRSGVDLWSAALEEVDSAEK